jgi:dolichol-phosphate mannosyltransferase
LAGIARADHHVVVVHFARNFGHQIAISAGLEHSRGQTVVVMDGDLQDPPEVLPDLLARLREGYEVVYAIREKRKENILLRAAYALFYRLMKRFASIDVPLDAGDFCIMERRVVDLLSSMPERNRFVRGIRSWIGFRQVGLPYERSARYAGRAKYTLKRLVLLALDGLISFSHVPLRFITVLGLSVSALSVVLAIFYTAKKLFFQMDPPGFTTLVVAILLLSGLQLVTLGVIGEYVGRIADEVKGRPLYVVRSIIRDGSDTP